MATQPKKIVGQSSEKPVPSQKEIEEAKTWLKKQTYSVQQLYEKQSEKSDANLVSFMNRRLAAMPKDRTRAILEADGIDVDELDRLATQPDENEERSKPFFQGEH